MPELGWELFSIEDKARVLSGMAMGSSTLPPRTIEIDWTDRCNVDCFFCSQSEMRRSGGDLSLDVLDRCFTEMDALGVRTLNAAGGGDPLFHRQIVPILESIRSRAFRIGTITTNAVLARGRVAELLLDTVREQISVSLNSFGGDDYAAVMRTTPRNYERVLDNVRYLVAERKKRGQSGPVIALQFLVHDDTAGQIRKMFDLADELNVDRVVFNPLMFFDSLSKRVIGNPDAFLSDVEALFRTDRRGIIADIRTIDPALNARIARLRLTVAPERYKSLALLKRNYESLQSFCSLPWFNMHVKANGAVYPCCALLSPDFKPFGNVVEQSLLEIWEGGPYREFREKHSEFTRAVRDGDQQSQGASPLPKPCTVHGMCFLRALPYLDDTPFAVAVDALGRCHPQVSAIFPESMRDGTWAGLSIQDPGTLRERSPDVFINHQRCGAAVRRGDAFEFGFQPEPLAAGFHLLEFRVDDKVLASRMVEKVASAPVSSPSAHGERSGGDK